MFSLNDVLVWLLQILLVSEGLREEGGAIPNRSNANISSQNVPNPQVLLWFLSGLKSLMLLMKKILQLWIFLKFVHPSAICCHQAFLRDLEWGRQQQPSFWKRLHFRRVEMGVRKTLQILEKDYPPPSA